jgi:protein-disulfide isomerase
MRQSRVVRRVVHFVAWTAAAGWIALGSPAIAQEPAAPSVRAGKPDAPARFEVFCDLDVKACGALVRTLGRVLDEQPETVAVTFRHLAPAGHAGSHLAYRAALAAARQDRGWSMLDLLYANPDQRDGDQVGAMAVRLGLDAERFARDIDDPSIARVTEADAAEAARLGVRSTPALFLNGSRLPDSFTYDAVVKAIEGAGRQ